MAVVIHKSLAGVRTWCGKDIKRNHRMPWSKEWDSVTCVKCNMRSKELYRPQVSDWHLGALHQASEWLEGSGREFGRTVLALIADVKALRAENALLRAELRKYNRRNEKDDTRTEMHHSHDSNVDQHRELPVPDAPGPEAGVRAGARVPGGGGLHAQAGKRPRKKGKGEDL